MAMEHILLIEDDQRLAQMVCDYLQQFGFVLSHALNGQLGLQKLQNAQDLPQHLPQHLLQPAQLVILDLMLPDMDGLEVCRTIRALPNAFASIPVLMLTAKGDPMDRVVGLELGADDYLSKPFEPRELLARVRAIFRRQALQGDNASTPTRQPILRFGRLELDRDARTVSVAGKISDLTSYQFDLLMVLAQRAGRVLSRDQIMEAVRGRELEAFDRSIDVHMGRIRAAIEDDLKSPKRILTVRGVGYVFAKQQD
jgi:DNA-binding response OmpR family regulator